MARKSAFRSTWEPNKRPYVVMAPDAYVAIQGETSVIGCGECRREVNINKFVTGISTEASVDSPPGSATVNLSIPDNQINQFYTNDQFIIIPMMEIEIYAKGYFTIGGFPQYYRIFWGLVNSVNQSWSNGVSSVTLNCKDILRWWELTNVVVNPAWLDIGKSGSGYNLFGNKFSGMNPYTVIIALAREAMGDFSLTQGSFTSFRPEDGAERGVITSYARDIMLYWQLKFGKIWNNLVLYGTSGTAYTFTGSSATVSPLQVSTDIWRREESTLSLNEATTAFKIQPGEIAAVKVDFSKAGDVDFFQNESQTKLQIAMTCRDQAGAYEFYCDTTGDIIFKPPFFNLNTMPNKPVSWIQDFEVISDSISESEQDIFTHVTSSGNAFGGVIDYGLNDDITTPRTGVIDWHLLRRYGWRRLNLQLEWAGNPRKLFYHCLDHMDKVNSKRVRGTVTIPMRPELRMGFPIWFPKYDSFFYVAGIGHTYSPGGQAATTLTLTAKRSKFIAPKNIGVIKRALNKKREVKRKGYKDKRTGEQRTEYTYAISFPSRVGGTAGISSAKPRQNVAPTNQTGSAKQKANQTAQHEGTTFDEPAILRDVKTGKLLGFPNAVMVYRTTFSGDKLAQIIGGMGSSTKKRPQSKTNKGQGLYRLTVGEAFSLIDNEEKSEIIDRLRLHRYEAGMTNTGAYDYAHDENSDFKEFSVIPTDLIAWGTGGDSPESQENLPELKAAALERAQKRINKLDKQIKEIREGELKTNQDELTAIKKQRAAEQKSGTASSPVQSSRINKAIAEASAAVSASLVKISELQDDIAVEQGNIQNVRRLEALNVMVRPVSDEFGFEVIGHYRYGRGAFIDRGQVQILSEHINKVNVQFAAHGGLLTDGMANQNYGPESKSFAEAFEKMTPEDYVTGASFKGSNYGPKTKLLEVNPTGQSTYTNAINSTIRDSRGGRAIFVESDSLRRAVTLAELKPSLHSINIGGADVFTKCNCAMIKTNWLSVLPQELITQMLTPTTSSSATSSEEILDQLAALPVDDSTYRGLNERDIIKLTNTPYEEEVLSKAFSLGATREELIAIIEEFIVDNDQKYTSEQKSEGIAATLSGLEARQQRTEGNTLAAQGDSGLNMSLEPGGFLNLLYDYLRERFNQDYEKNMQREKFASSGGRNIFRPNDGFEQSNVLPLPNNSLFNRAAKGDVDALNALTYGANLNFGQTEAALEKFKDQFKEGGSVDQKSQNLVDNVEKIFDPESGELVPPTFLDPGAQGLAALIEESQQEFVVEEQAEEDAKEGTTPLQTAIFLKQQPTATVAATKKPTLKVPKSLQKGQHQPPTQPVKLNIPINTEPAPQSGLGTILYPEPETEEEET